MLQNEHSFKDIAIANDYDDNSCVQKSIHPPYNSHSSRAAVIKSFQRNTLRTSIMMRAEPIGEGEDIVCAPHVSSLSSSSPVVDLVQEPREGSVLLSREATFEAPPVVYGIEDTLSDRISGSLSELSSRISCVMRDSSESVTRVLKKAVPANHVHPFSPCPLLLAFGDSLTERGVAVTEKEWGIGWVANLADKLRGRADVIARGFSGYNTRNALTLLPRVLAGPCEHASIVLVWFGANDSVIRGRGEQHVSIEEYRLNLCKIIFDIRNHRKESPIIPVLVTPPPLQQEMSDARWSVEEGGTRANENTKAYAAACADIAKRMNVHCIDVYSKMSFRGGDQQGLQQFLCDGLHLSDAGNALVAELVYEQLCENVPGFAENELAQWFPPWRSFHATTDLMN